MEAFGPTITKMPDQKGTNILPDGRKIRTLRGTKEPQADGIFTGLIMGRPTYSYSRGSYQACEEKLGYFRQMEMFKLRERGLVQQGEEVMRLAEYLEAIRSGAWESRNVRTCFRCREYSVHRAGFDHIIDLPLGKSITWVNFDDPNCWDFPVWVRFEIPDVPVSVGISGSTKTISLRQSSGLAVFDIDDLEIKFKDERTMIVSVKTNFQPEKVRVVDIFRASYMDSRRSIVGSQWSCSPGEEGRSYANWALPDTSGFPLRSKRARKNKDAIFLVANTWDDFEDSRRRLREAAINLRGDNKISHKEYEARMKRIDELDGWHGSVTFGTISMSSFCSYHLCTRCTDWRKVDLTEQWYGPRNFIEYGDALSVGVIGKK